MKTQLLKLVFLALFGLISLVSFSQGTVKGKILDSKTNDPLVGASIVKAGTTNGTITDFDGNFSMTLPEGKNTIQISFIGYDLFAKTVTVTNGQTTDLGTVKLEASAIAMDELVVIGKGVIDMEEDRKTPIAVSTITIQEIQSKAVGNVEFPEVMKNTPSVYVASQGGGFGDSKMFLRGFSQANTAFLLNGQPINGMEDGLMYWSNWAGMTDMANAVQVQRGLGSSKLAISSVGGTVNIVTKATEKQKGGYVRLMSGDNGYAKGTIAYNTGINDKGWGFSMMFDYWKGDRKYFDGTRGKGQNYFISIGKKAGASTFNLLLLGSPQWHDQNYTKSLTTVYSGTNIKTPGYDILGKKGNSNYGFLDGEYLSMRRNYYHKPVMNFNWDWSINDKSNLSTVLYASWGRGGGTGNYGNSPGYITGGYASNGRIDWDAVVDYNGTISGGIASGYNGMLLRASVNNHNWYGLVTNYENKISENFTANVGADFRFYKGTHFRELTDLLGMDGRSETFAGETRVVSATFNPNPWASLFKYADEDERVDYDYDEVINYQGIFGQAEWNNDVFSIFVQAAASNQQYKGIDRGNFTTEQESDFVNKMGYNIKGGLSYSINAQNVVFANIGQYSRQPFRDAIFTNYDDETEYDTSVDNEHIFSIEGGYKLELAKFKLNLNAYYTKWDNRFESSSGSDYTVGGVTYTDVDYLMPNIGEVHSGVELDLRYRPTAAWLVKAYTSIGNWKYDGSTPVNVRDENTSSVVDNFEIDLTGSKVGSAPQFSGGISTSYDIIMNKFIVDLDWNYYDKLYEDVDAADVAEASLNGESYEPEEINSYGLINMGATYKFNLANSNFNLRANVYNLFDKEYFTQKDSYGYMYGLGTTFNVALRYNF
ncbi:TonB-dependent receptor [Mangrovibacterium diazotrophicum]|uniref:Outer membrane receptor protein involved in Fe transport n=1 Tax=Mangrovibacterium diazotrophicum TaxID=1261403 RepID=A0A419W9D9_9BACT|nr:TonB-dependent receptor [Mangrovibacterium diazotrophicum]RKD92091.1 outer membrane receptor protein involved in Fe transport [Mangrovibacterium diazotrophicum]